MMRGVHENAAVVKKFLPKGVLTMVLHSIMRLPDSVLHTVLQKYCNILENRSVSTSNYKHEETPTLLDLTERAVLISGQHKSMGTEVVRTKLCSVNNTDKGQCPKILY
jgi:hypothetical protein